MVNNRKLIEPLLEFPKPGDSFYFIQILQRKKDNPELGNNSRVIKTYYIRSVEHLDFYWKEMIKLAEVFNARVSINLNPRSFEKAGFQLMSKVAHQMENKDFTHIYKAYESICGNYHSEMDKRWLIDIDEKSEDVVKFVSEEIIKIQSQIGDNKSKNHKILAVLPTKAGFHIITNPFRVDLFQKSFKYDLHKNNPTLLYCL